MDRAGRLVHPYIFNHLAISAHCSSQSKLFQIDSRLPGKKTPQANSSQGFFSSYIHKGTAKISPENSQVPDPTHLQTRLLSHVLT